MAERIPIRRSPIRPESISRRQVDRVAPLLVDLIARTGIQLSRDAVQLTPDRMKVMLPSRAEIETARARGSPLYTILLVSANPIPTPDPAEPIRRVGALPEPIPGGSRDPFTALVAEVIREKRGIRVSSQQVSYIGQNGKVALPSRRELERMQSGSTPIYGILLISTLPVPLP